MGYRHTTYNEIDDFSDVDGRGFVPATARENIGAFILLVLTIVAVGALLYVASGK